MGGENSEIGPQTNNIFLESAHFDSVNNRKTSRHFSLRTDASNRFEKGVDPDGQIKAAERSAALIWQVANGQVLAGIVDEGKLTNHTKRGIYLPFAKVKKVLGVNIDKDDQKSNKKIVDILKGLKFSIVEQSNSALTVEPPSFRGDIEKDVDLIEEIAKISGYHKIPATIFKSTVIQKGKSFRQKAIAKARKALVGCGMYEMISYSMITEEDLNGIRIPSDHHLRHTIHLANPLIKDQTMMRTTLIPGILKTLQWNAYRQVDKIKLFEIGKVFFPKKNKDKMVLPEEKLMISGALAKIGRGDIWEKTNKWDFFHMKGILNTLFDKLRLQRPSYQINYFSAFEPRKNAIIKINNLPIGILGEIHPDIQSNLGIPVPIYLFEIDFDAICPLINQKITFNPLPKYPSVQRDIAVLVSENIPVAKMINVIKSVDSVLITNVELFDIFKGKQIEEGYKSVAFSITIQAKDHTLTDIEIEKIVKNVKIELKNKFQADLRE